MNFSMDFSGGYTWLFGLDQFDFEWNKNRPYPTQVCFPADPTFLYKKKTTLSTKDQQPVQNWKPCILHFRHEIHLSSGVKI